jgi:hypothetical protein
MSGGAAFMIAELFAGKNSHAPIALIVPSGSSRCLVRSPLSRSTRSATAIASTPVGTLIQKIQRHDT